MNNINESESSSESVLPELIDGSDEEIECPSQEWPLESNVDYNIMDDDEYIRRLDFKPTNISIDCKNELKLHLHAALLCKPELLVEKDGIDVDKVDINMRTITGGLDLSYIGYKIAPNDQKIMRDKANVLSLKEFSDLVDSHGGSFKPKPLDRTKELYETIIRAGIQIKNRAEMTNEKKRRISEKPEARLKAKVACNFFIELIDRERQIQRQPKVLWQQVQNRFTKIFDESNEDYDLYVKYTSGIRNLKLADLKNSLNATVIRELTGRSSICKALSMPAFSKIEFEEVPEKTGCILVSIKQVNDEDPSYTMQELEEEWKACLESKQESDFAQVTHGRSAGYVPDPPKQQNIPIISKRQDPKTMSATANPPVIRLANEINNERDCNFDTVEPSETFLNVVPSTMLDSDSSGTETEVSDGGRYSDDDEEEHMERQRRRKEEKAARLVRQMERQKAKSSMQNPILNEGPNSALPASSKASSEFENSAAETPIFMAPNPWDQSKTSSRVITDNIRSHAYTKSQIPSLNGMDQSVFTRPPSIFMKNNDMSMDVNMRFSTRSLSNVMPGSPNLEVLPTTNEFQIGQERETAFTSSVYVSNEQKNGTLDDLDRFRGSRTANWNNNNSWFSDPSFPMNTVDVGRARPVKDAPIHQKSYLSDDIRESDSTRNLSMLQQPIRNESFGLMTQAQSHFLSDNKSRKFGKIVTNCRDQTTQTANILEVLEELSHEGLITNKSDPPKNPSERGARRVCLDLIRDMVWAHRHSTSPITLKSIVNILPPTMAPEAVFETNNWHEVVKRELPEVELWPFNNTFVLSWKESVIGH